MVFLDITKAFDKVWHSGIIYKLNKTIAPIYITKLRRSYMDNRTFCIRMNNTRSSTRPIEAGIPQGSPLGPTLFNIYISDIQPPKYTTITFFADDSALMHKHKYQHILRDHLNSALDEIHSWYTKRRLTVNAEKSQAIMLSRKHQDPVRRLLYNDQQIHWANEAKYLGIIFDPKLRFSPHIKQGITIAKQAAFRLRSLIGRQSKLPIKTKLWLYKSIIIPHMTYGCPVWIHAIQRWITKATEQNHTSDHQLTVVCENNRHTQGSETRNY